MKISYDQFLQLSEKIFNQINQFYKKECKGIICPLNGGLYLSDYLSKRSGVPIYCIDVKSYNKKHVKENIEIKNFMPLIIPGNYIIADDIYDSGETIRSIIDFYSFQDKFKFDVCVLITNKVVDRVNYYGMFNQTKDWISFPWEIEND